jgi:hypothetical protein
MIRTCDLCLRRAALYPLSYGREEVSVAVAQPSRFAAAADVRGCGSGGCRRDDSRKKSSWPRSGRTASDKGALYPLSYGRELVSVAGRFGR